MHAVCTQQMLSALLTEHKSFILESENITLKLKGKWVVKKKKESNVLDIIQRTQAL